MCEFAYSRIWHQPNWAVKRTPTQAMPSAFSWPALVPYAPSVLRRRLPWALGFSQANTFAIVNVIYTNTKYHPMKLPIQLFFGGLLIFLVIIHLWVSDSFSGDVTDSHGKPLKDAVVLVVWKTKSGHPREIMKILEAETDKEGHFEIPGWIGLSPQFLGYLSDIDVFVVHSDHLPLDLSRDLFFSRRFINATPKDFGYFPLLPLSEMDQERITKDMEGLHNKICNLSFESRSAIKSAKFFKAVSNIEKKTPEAHRRMSECGIRLDN